MLIVDGYYKKKKNIHGDSLFISIIFIFILFFAANWTPKYDGINLRPRAGLVFVEPTIYDEVLKEEQMIRTGQTRNSMRNLTLETDNNMLETVDL